MVTNEEDAKTELNEEAKTANVVPEKVAGSKPEEEETKGSNQESVSKKATESDKRGVEVEMKKKEVSPPKEAVVDKELLQVLYQTSKLTLQYSKLICGNLALIISNFDVLKNRPSGSSIGTWLAIFG